MRNIPPVIVSIITGIAFTGVSVAAISGSLESGTEAPEHYREPEITVERPAENTVFKTEPETESEYISAIYSRDWDAEESQMLLKIAMEEAEGESVEGKALVMLVVLNRVWNDDFPDTIEEVIFQPKQFSTAREGDRYYTTEPDKGCYEALELVINGWDESGGALYFESFEGGSWHSENLEYLFQVENHKFYR